MSEPMTLDGETPDASMVVAMNDFNINPDANEEDAAAMDEDEEEVDELMDDDDEEGELQQGDEAAPAQGSDLPKKSSTSAGKKPTTIRTPGTSLIPASRITKIMKADKEVGITAKEAVFLVSVATVR
jgi:hypothetical protein